MEEVTFELAVQLALLMMKKFELDSRHLIDFEGVQKMVSEGKQA